MKIEDSVVVRKALGGVFSRDGIIFHFRRSVLKDKMKKQ